MYSGGQRKTGWTLQLFGGSKVCFGFCWGFFCLFLYYKINLLCNLSPCCEAVHLRNKWGSFFLAVVATVPGCLTFNTADTRYLYLCNTSNMTFQIKWPMRIQFYCSFWGFFPFCFFFFKHKGREWEKMAGLLLFVHLFIKFILKGEVLCSLILPPYFTRLMKRSADSANRVKEQSRWDGCCWCDSRGHYLSSRC